VNDATNTTATTEPIDLLWGARAIAHAIGRSETQTRWRIRSGAIPTRKVGKQHVASRATVLRTIIGEGA
jgi:hypothetical protein